MGEAGALSPVPAVVSSGLRVECPRVLLTPWGLTGASTAASQGLARS